MNDEIELVDDEWVILKDGKPKFVLEENEYGYKLYRKV